MIRDNLIRCGVGLPVKDDYTYEELFNLSEEIDQILWYYRVLAIANSRDKLKDFIFPMDRTYVSYMRNVFYKEYCESKKDRREVTISGLVPNTDIGYEYRDIDEEEVLEKSFEDSEDSGEGTISTDSSNSESLENVESSESEGTNYDLTDEDLDEIWGSEDSWGTDEENSESDSTEQKNSVDEIKDSVNADKTDIEQVDSDLKELQDSVIYVTMDMLEIDEKGFYVYSTEDDEDAEEVDPFEDDSNDTLWEDEDEQSESIKNMDEISATDDFEDDFPDRDFDEEDEDSGSDIPNNEDEDDIFSSWGDEPDENVDDVENEEDEEDVDFPDNEDIEDDEDDIPDNNEEDDVDFPEDTVDAEEDDLSLSWGNEDNEDDEDFPSNNVDDEEEDFPDLSDEDEDIPDNGDSEDVDEDEDDFPDLNSEDEEDSDDAEDFPDWNDEDNQDNDDDDIDFSDWDEDQDDEDEEKVKHSVNKNKGSIKGDKPTPSKKDGVGSKGIKSGEGVQDSFEHTRDEKFVESFDKVINDTLNFGRKSGKKIINKIWKGMTNQE